MPTAPKQWPQHVAQYRDETLTLAEESKKLLKAAREEANPDRRAALLADASANQERIARLMESSGAKK